MAIDPTDISGESITWQPTAHLRFVGRKRKTAELEQKWINRSTKAEEWREIPFVHSQSEGD